MRPVELSNYERGARFLRYTSILSRRSLTKGGGNVVKGNDLSSQQKGTSQKGKFFPERMGDQPSLLPQEKEKLSGGLFGKLERRIRFNCVS